MVFTEPVWSPPNLSISQIFTKICVFHLKSWFWQKSGHFWSGTFWPVICLIPPHQSSTHWSFLARVILNFATLHGPFGVQSCIEISKMIIFDAIFELSQNLNLRSAHLHHVTSGLGHFYPRSFRVIFCSHGREEILFTGFRIAFWHFINMHSDSFLDCVALF